MTTSAAIDASIDISYGCHVDVTGDRATLEITSEAEALWNDDGVAGDVMREALRREVRTLAHEHRVRLVLVVTSDGGWMNWYY